MKKDFPTLARHLAKQKDKVLTSCRVLAIDPGETSGFATFEDADLVDTGELKTKDMDLGVAAISGVLEHFKPEVLVCEDYRIYGWKTKDHAWSSLHTPQLIGAINTLAIWAGVPMVKQSAQVAKQFCTNDKLQQWNYYRKGEPHGRDAVRHGCYYILFGTKGK